MNVRTSTALLIATMGFFLSACGGGGGDEGLQGVVCTTEVRSSVVLTVVDVNAAAIPSVLVSYQVNGGPTLSQVCPATGTCSVGQEQSGRFTLSVSKVGFVTAAAEAQVARDLCHVLTEQVRVVLRQAT